MRWCFCPYAWWHTLVLPLNSEEYPADESSLSHDSFPRIPRWVQFIFLVLILFQNWWGFLSVSLFKQVGSYDV
jgi:hypothetical protein